MLLIQDRDDFWFLVYQRILWAIHSRWCRTEEKIDPVSYFAGSSAASWNTT